jgi:hypothetical protein
MELHVRTIFLRTWGLLFLLLFNNLKTEAHPMPNSILKLFVLENTIKAEALVPVIELENAISNKKDRLSDIPFLKKYFLSHINIVSNKRNWNVKIDTICFLNSYNEIVGDYKEIKVCFLLTPPKINYLRNFELHYDAVLHQVITHSINVILCQDWKNGLNEEFNTKELGVLNYNIEKDKFLPLKVDLDNGSNLTGFTSMIKMGMLHIKNGTDHLLFLLTLLLPAFLLSENREWTSYIGLKKGLYKIIKIITAFTIGHSITLIIGAFDFFKVPTQLIEILIAISILISAFHCIIPIFYKKESLIAIGFGFIHGLAFSQTLQVLNISNLNLAISVLGFNIGIEVMQLCIILLIVPWFIVLSKTSFFKTIKNILAIFIGIAAIGWIVQRITNTSNFLSSTIDKLFLQSIWLIIGIAILSIILFYMDNKFSKKL